MPEEALRRACYVIKVLFANRADIRDEYKRLNGRMGVFGPGEFTTSIPEHSHLDSSYYDDRTCGLGPTAQHPIATGCSDNLLCNSSNKYESNWCCSDTQIRYTVG